MLRCPVDFLPSFYRTLDLSARDSLDLTLYVLLTGSIGSNTRRDRLIVNRVYKRDGFRKD